MAETQRKAVPRNDGGEIDTALAFLAFARECVIKKTEGVSEEDLRRPMVESGTSLLGLVQHMVDGERFWFGYCLGGRGVDDFDFSMQVPASRPVAEVMQDYADAIAESDEILSGIEDFNQPMANPIDGNRHSVRWVVTHMVGETTRHAGHADILRELIDGITGR